MKNTTLFLIASFAVIATNAIAASSQSESELVVLPTFVVAAPRYLPVEKQLKASLDELRRQADTPSAISVELSKLTTELSRHGNLARAPKEVKAARLAKS